MEFTPIAHSTAAVEDSERACATAGAWAADSAVEKEHMFEKVVTPSDVGKLNRLVVPKQHAERYFPLDAAAANGGKGLVLSFEDRTGKAWRFRYSYWNSSQSYVMTKGWSRFVKEKRLGAGDTVSFGRGIGEAARGRLFIDFCRRRQDASSMVFPPPVSQRLPLPSVYLCPWRDYSTYGSAAGSNRHVLFLRPQMPAAVVLKPVPVRVAASAVEATRHKRVRLFGVNLDCPVMEDGEDGARATRTAASTLLQLPSPSSSTVGKEMCTLDLGL